MCKHVYKVIGETKFLLALGCSDNLTCGINY